MKKLVLLLLIPLLFFACDMSSDGDKETPLTATPDAQTEDDDKATGVYKGVIADSDTSGTYKIEIDSTPLGRSVGDSYKATLYMEVDGTTISKEGTATEQSDGSLKVTFSLTIVGSVFDFDLTVSSSGDISSVSVKMDGEEIGTTVKKESSTTLLEAWEGTYEGNVHNSSIPDGYYVKNTGTWNFLIEGNKLEGLYSGKETTNMPAEYYTPDLSQKGNYTGLIIGDSITLEMADDGPEICSGQKTGDSVNGTWSFDDGSSDGSWKGTRSR
ncbi:MAG: hypothetical protein B6241_03370 [Spirochaetaceae bacterium 4572_59]|nr:MAG: hypothetical protein B6241_03370 [Spirochaetaceae bacterium 4572_59]